MTEIDKSSVQFVTRAPRNHNFGSNQCLRKYSPLKHVPAKTDSPQDKNLAVLFFRKNWSTSSKDNFSKVGDKNQSKPESSLKEQKSEYSICTICALKKKKKDLKKIVKISSSESETTEDSTDSTTDTDEYQECNSNISSTHSILENPMYKKHLMLSRETQTSFIFSDAGYDRALKIDYGKRNYLSYKNLYGNQQEKHSYSEKFSKEDTDVEGEYVINCLKYNSATASSSYNHDNYKTINLPSKTKKKPTPARGSKRPDIHLEKPSVIKNLSSDKKRVKPQNVEKSALPDMHARAISLMKKAPKNKKDDSFSKIKLLEMTGKEIMGQNYEGDNWNKKRRISHRRTTLKQKIPLHSFTCTNSNLNLTKNSSYMLGCYQKSAPSAAPSGKIKVRKMKKLKG